MTSVSADVDTGVAALVALTFAVVALVVTAVWVFALRHRSFAVLSLAMYVPAVTTVLFVAASGGDDTWGTRSSVSSLSSSATTWSAMSAQLLGFVDTFEAGTVVLATLYPLAFCFVGVAFNLATRWAVWADVDGDRGDKDDDDGKHRRRRHSRQKRSGSGVVVGGGGGRAHNGQWISGFARAAGEELGWRCYLLPLLMRCCASPAAALTVSGVVWGLYHVPVMVLLASRRPTTQPKWHAVRVVVVQFMSCVLMAFPIGWVAVRSGYALWAPTLLHWAWNRVNPIVFGSIYTSTNGWMCGEQWLMNGEGLMGCVVGMPVALACWYSLST